jgi:hypothetical protein
MSVDEKDRYEILGVSRHATSEDEENSVEAHENLRQTQEDLRRHLLDKKLKQKMSYAKKVSIALFSGVSGVYVGFELRVSIVLMCIIGIIGICAGSVFWSMLWYLLDNSKKDLYDVVQDSEPFDGIILLSAIAASILHAVTLRVVFIEQFSMMPPVIRFRGSLSAAGGVTFIELFLFVLIFCGAIKIFLWEKKEISYRDFE